MVSLERHPETHDQAPANELHEASRPDDIYRLAVIVEGLLDSANDQDALKTIRGELRELIHDLAPMDAH
jgi:hypothetical protein